MASHANQGVVVCKHPGFSRCVDVGCGKRRCRCLGCGKSFVFWMDGEYMRFRVVRVKGGV